MSGRRTLALAATLALGAVIARPAPARANPMDMYGLGSRSIAMGGAVSADASDVSANYYNPAGLVRGRAVRLEVGYFYAWNRLRTNNVDNQVDPAHGVVTGLAIPARLFGLPVAAGLVLHVPDDRLARSRLLPQSQPRWELYDNRIQRLYFAANIAIAPLPWLRIGGGFVYLASTRGTLGLAGEIPVLAPTSAQLTHTVDADVRAVLYPQAGVQVDVTSWLSFGITYRGEFRFRLDLDANLDLVVTAGMVRAAGTLGLSAGATTAFLPQQGVLGAAVRPIPGLTLVADLTFVNWSRYENPTANVDFALAFERPPGTEGIPVPMIPPQPRPSPAAFHDTFVPRLGAEFRRALDAANTYVLAARAGYRYDASPVPNQGGPTNFLDSNRHVVSAGVGFTFRGGPTRESSISLDLHGDVQILEHRVMIKDDPADPIGDYALDGHVINLGATLATTF